jgi:hypothetical protein
MDKPNVIQVNHRVLVTLPASIRFGAYNLLKRFPALRCVALRCVDHDEGDEADTELFTLEVNDMDSTRQLVLWIQLCTALEPDAAS